MQKEIISTPNAPAAIGPYSQAYQCGNTLYCSGQIAINPETNEFIGGTIEEQTEKCIKNISELLKAADYSFDDVVKTTCFLANMSDFTAFNNVYAKYFTGKPARSCVAVKELPKKVLCEVEIIAIREK